MGSFFCTWKFHSDIPRCTSVFIHVLIAHELLFNLETLTLGSGKNFELFFQFPPFLVFLSFLDLLY